jgi:hypothetical protein
MIKKGLKSNKKRLKKEECDGVINTASMAGTAYDSSGNVSTPVFGNNSAYVPSYFGMTSRYGDYKKKRKKKNIGMTSRYGDYKKKRKKKNRRKKNESLSYKDYIDGFLEE